MNNAYWSYILTAVGVFGLYLAGRKVWWAWYVGLAAQGLWVAYALATKQYGFLISAAAYGWVYLKNGLAWQAARNTPETLLNDSKARKAGGSDVQSE